jgi:hypothetical protein
MAKSGAGKPDPFSLLQQYSALLPAPSTPNSLEHSLNRTTDVACLEYSTVSQGSTSTIVADVPDDCKACVSSFIVPLSQNRMALDELKGWMLWVFYPHTLFIYTFGGCV